ncbi:hypothetical protein [Agrobacterium sp. ST15.13.015]|nr:hypothetical protein [Agrobacterium sp. ST15.13.015]MCZ7500838.1 hypothetical protein [Rhizobium rhizogenes]
MTPIQSKALDLAAWLFIWTVRIVGTIFAVSLLTGIIGGILTT